MLKKIAKAGDVFTIYFNSLDRVGHTGIFLEWRGDKLVTIEGNTNNNGSRLGDGVYQRERYIREIYAITDYISPFLKNNGKFVTEVKLFEPIGSHSHFKLPSSIVKYNYMSGVIVNFNYHGQYSNKALLGTYS